MEVYASRLYEYPAGGDVCNFVDWPRVVSRVALDCGSGNIYIFVCQAKYCVSRCAKHPIIFEKIFEENSPGVSNVLRIVIKNT